MSDLPAVSLLDRFVTEALWPDNENENRWPRSGMIDSERNVVWSPSTDIAHAWEVVELMRLRNALSLDLSHNPNRLGDHWDAVFRQKTGRQLAVSKRMLASGSTAAEAICRAAVKALATH